MKTIFASMILLASVMLNCQAGQILAYSNDFDGNEAFRPGVAGGFSGFMSIESVQGYAGIGTGGDVFAGDFLRNYSGRDYDGAAIATELTLTNLPAHTSIDLSFLFAAIDTWDSRATGGFDIFNVRVDGVTIFSQGFANVENGTTMNYSPPPGVLLTPAPFPQLGWNTDEPGWNHESAYNLGLDPSILNIAHTQATLTIQWFATGEQFAFQGGTDESWAIENVRVNLNTAIVPEPPSALLMGLGLLTLLGFRLKSKRSTGSSKSRG